jgi:hypothetical protein
MARENLLTKLGFRFGTNGPHAARTMMLDDLATLFTHLPATARREDYSAEVIDRNCLGKPTRKARELAFRHMSILYGLDPGLAVYKALRRLWAGDEAARPVLALSAALARDPLLRSTQDFILAKHPGEAVSRNDLEKLLESNYPDRFSPASLKSFAQNVNGTWTQAGFLVGRSRKTRARPKIAPANVAFSLFLGHLEGLSGQLLFSSTWAKLLDSSPGELEAMAGSASHRGLLVFMSAGGVKELRFPDYLSPEQESWRQEASRV